MPPTKAQIVKIHIAKKALSMDDDMYRDILMMIELKEWQYMKEIDDWNESVRAKEAA